MSRGGGGNQHIDSTIDYQLVRFGPDHELNLVMTNKAIIIIIITIIDSSFLQHGGTGEHCCLTARRSLGSNPSRPRSFVLSLQSSYDDEMQKITAEGHIFTKQHKLCLVWPWWRYEP